MAIAIFAANASNKPHTLLDVHNYACIIICAVCVRIIWCIIQCFKPLYASNESLTMTNFSFLYNDITELSYDI